MHWLELIEMLFTQQYNANKSQMPKAWKQLNNFIQIENYILVLKHFWDYIKHVILELNWKKNEKKVNAERTFR